jgi:predicted  nucleic acid-binding Zn-ribbon protein
MAEGRSGLIQVSEVEFEDMYKEIKELRARIAAFQLRIKETTEALAAARRDSEKNAEFVKVLKQRATEKGVSLHE